MKVIGVGYQKTGAKTLTSCLSELNYEVCGFRLVLLKKYKCESSLEELKPIMNRYDAFQDIPWFLMYGNLTSIMMIYITRKDSETWWRSMAHSEIPFYNESLRTLVYDHKDFMGHKEYYKFKYENHNEKVRDFFKNRDDFTEVCWEEGDSWKEICSFLNKEPPKIPFPHKNKSNVKLIKNK